MYNIWKPKEIQFLKDHYSSKGAKQCAKDLQRTVESVRHKASRLKIKALYGKRKTTDEYKQSLPSIISVLDEYIDAKTGISHKCEKCNNIWKARPTNILQGKGCPKCAKYGIDLNKPTEVYFVKLTVDNIEYYKLGITNKTCKERLQRYWNRFQVTIMWTIYCQTGHEAYIIEQKLIKENNRFLLDLNVLDSGNTETFSVEIEKP